MKKKESYKPMIPFMFEFLINFSIQIVKYLKLKALAVNGYMYLESFISYLINKIKVFKNDEELTNMKKLFEFIFQHFDEGNEKNF
jgi:hypothetical protein